MVFWVSGHLKNTPFQKRTCKTFQKHESHFKNMQVSSKTWKSLKSHFKNTFFLTYVSFVFFENKVFQVILLVDMWIIDTKAIKTRRYGVNDLITDTPLFNWKEVSHSSCVFFTPLSLCGRHIWKMTLEICCCLHWCWHWTVKTTNCNYISPCVKVFMRQDIGLH